MEGERSEQVIRAEAEAAQLAARAHAVETAAKVDSDRAAGQRRVNVIWEITQAIIALVVTGSVLYASVITTLRNETDKTAFIFMTNVLFTVIGFYFGRTNHQRVGGTGLNTLADERR